MDFASVAGITIPAGSVNKISIGGVVVWNKTPANKYKILKDGLEVAQVTMLQFVKAVQSGAAQEDWGIGAQIVIPYHDQWDEKTYQLPFNFGTFTAYGEGKLGLQAHYAIPTTTLLYGQSIKVQDYYVSWGESDIRKWLNSYGVEHGLTETKYVGKIGFLGCLPEDLVDIMNTTSHNSEGSGIESKIFLLSATNSYAITGSDFYNTLMVTITQTVGDGEFSAWEYWKNKINFDTPQKLSNGNVPNRISKTILGTACVVILPNKLYVNAASTPYYSQAGFSDLGKLYVFSDKSYFYLPACVIG